jgi:hypothetical protein
MRPLGIVLRGRFLFVRGSKNLTIHQDLLWTDNVREFLRIVHVGGFQATKTYVAGDG